LLTITIGLLIALALEAAAQSLHHRHIVRAAQANLRREIAGNHALYVENLRSLENNLVELDKDIDQLRSLRSGVKLDKPDLSWQWTWSSYGQAAWKSARDIGATSYMEPRDIENYSTIYDQQAYVNDSAIAIVNDETKAVAPLFVAKRASDLNPGELQSVLTASAELYARIKTLESTMKTLDDDYTKALAGQTL
jgi:hypothetical protein